MRYCLSATIRKTAAVLATAAMILASAPFSTVAGADTPPVSWSPKAVSLTAARGGSATQAVILKSSKSLTNVSLAVVPQLSPYVTVSPSEFTSLPAATPVSVAITATVPETAALGTLEGAIQLRAAGKNVAAPLPVVLTIGEAVGSSGGTVTSSDGAASLAVPAGALADTVTITVEPATGSVPETFGTAVTPLYDFGPDGLSFALPAMLTFDVPDGVDPSGLVIAFDRSGDDWLGLPTAVDPASRSATAAVFHFTRFALVRPAPAAAVIEPPTNVAVAMVGSSALVTWTPPAEHYAYAAISRAASATGPFTLLAFTEVGATSYTDTAPLGTGSCYEVKAVAKSGLYSAGVVACLEGPAVGPVAQQLDASSADVIPISDTMAFQRRVQIVTLPATTLESVVLTLEGIGPGTSMTLRVRIVGVVPDASIPGGFAADYSRVYATSANVTLTLPEPKQEVTFIFHSEALAAGMYALSVEWISGFNLQTIYGSSGDIVSGNCLRYDGSGAFFSECTNINLIPLDLFYIINGT